MRRQTQLWLSIFAALSVGLNGHAQVIASSAKEVHFEYRAAFVQSGSADQDFAAAALDHAQHMFGVMHSPTLVSRYGIDPEKVEGLGVPELPMQISVVNTKSVSGGTEVTYDASGLLLVHQRAAEKILAKTSFTLPLPYDLDKIYNKKCTDKEYDSLGDYWYFYDPYRQGCQYLLDQPYSRNVVMKISVPAQVPTTPDLDLASLRGDNGNGAKFSIYVINGFNDDTMASDDEGRMGFEALNRHLKKTGYEESVEDAAPEHPLYVYTKTVSTPESGEITVEIRHLLALTDIESDDTTFAKFFREAAEQGDVIVYNGHSGLGGNLDIASLEDKAGKFHFSPTKKQLFFFDACSSYSYYLQEFTRDRTPGQVNVISYGLESYFFTSEAVLESLFNTLLGEASERPWQEIMDDMERPLKGHSYLLNVGGI
ncbi:MAG: hypothetical protein JST16_18060 [Bdellovibrionales bacterium]|nr:hypothetical protein [Bdellovibrionales bacterium]